MVTDINRKIKIAQVITRMDWGGASDIVRIICEKLDKDKFETCLVAGLSQNLTPKTKIFLEQFKDKVFWIPQLRRNINPIFDLAGFLKLYFLFQKEKFDIVHTHTAKAGILGRLAAHFAHVPKIVHTSHGHNFYGYFGRVLSHFICLIERLAANFTEHIVCLTELEKKDLITFKITDEAKITIVHTVFETEKYRKLNPEEKSAKKKELRIGQDEIIVGMVGRLEPIKGPRYFIEAAQLIANKFKNVSFIVVGEGSLRKELEIQVEKAKLTEKVTFTGWRDDAVEIMNILDMLVLPSLNEAVGLVLIEAQSLGIPVIASCVGGIPEVVEDGKTGILVKAEDAQELKEAIEEIINNKEKRENMARQAEIYVKNKFKAQDFIKQISEIYEGKVKDAKK